MVECTSQCVGLISFNTCVSAPAIQQEDESQIQVATQDILGAATGGRVFVGGARQLVWVFDVATEGKTGRVEAVNTLHSSGWPEAKGSRRKLCRSCVALRWNICFMRTGASASDSAKIPPPQIAQDDNVRVGAFR